MKAIEPPASIVEFHEWFATERACERFLFSWRWPDGFRCPRCGDPEAKRLKTRRVYQCRRCRRQTSVTAGTVFHRSRVPLRKWFWAVFLVSRHKTSVSALQLKKDLGVAYNTAWFMLHRIRSCFDESVSWPLKGEVEVDETLVGAKGKGAKPGKDPGQKAIVVGAVQLGEKKKRGHRWKGVRLRCVADYSGKELGTFVRDHVERGSVLLTDGWRAYQHLQEQGYGREVDVSSQYTRSELRVQNPMPHVHLLFSNLKTWLTGTFHGVSHKYLPRYLAEYSYRVNRRHNPKMLFGWVLRRMTHSRSPTWWSLRAA